MSTHRTVPCVFYQNSKAKNAAKIANINGTLGNIAQKYGKYQCKQAAKAMQKELKKLKIDFKVVVITFTGGRGYIWSESKQEVISQNGVHVGIMVNGVVYCNVHPFGLPQKS